MLTSRLRRALACTLAGAVSAVPALVIGLAPSPAAAATDPALSGTASPMWQTNNDVNALAVTRGVIFAGGTFTTVRPPGGGTTQTSRPYLAAFNASTGALITSFNARLNGQVRDMAVSPDGNRLYVVGSFTSAYGATRNRVAAINLSGTGAGLTGALNATFNPNPNRLVWSVAATNDTVWFSGDFTTVRGTARANIASVTAATGALNAGFGTTLVRRPDQPCRTPGSNGCPASGIISYLPHALTMAAYTGGTTDTTDDRLLVGGNFMGVNGVNSGGMASLDPITGQPEVWNANTDQPINTNCAGRVTDIAVAGSQVFVTGEGDPPGCYEGTYAAAVSNGELDWLSSCLGASQGLTVMNGILYKASHQHDCALTEGGASGGFVGGTSRDKFVHQYLVGQDTDDGEFVHWYPNTNAAGTTSVGPHVIANDGNQVVVGGDFTRVNGVAQQGLARFVANGDTATPQVPGRNVLSDPWPDTVRTAAMSLPVRVLPTGANRLTIEVPAVIDWDTGTLTYRIYRDGSNTPFATQSVASFPWSRPVLRFDDTGLQAGSTHSYRVDATDGVRASARSTAVSGTVLATAPPSLANRYTSFGPTVWWPLSDTSDASGNGHTAAFQGGATPGTPGVNGTTAVDLDGADDYVTSSDQITAPGSFSVAAWFRTTTTKGGVIVAQSDQQSGSGGNTDRMITMDNDGNLVFALKANTQGNQFGVPTINFRNQGVIWNDGRWHLVVGTYDDPSRTINLYVDGSLQGSATGTPFDSTVGARGMATSYLRAGYADVSQMQLYFGINFYNRTWPVSPYFDGAVDEVAAFNTVLTPAQVQGLWASGGAG